MEQMRANEMLTAATMVDLEGLMSNGEVITVVMLRPPNLAVIAAFRAHELRGV